MSASLFTRSERRLAERHVGTLATAGLFALLAAVAALVAIRPGLFGGPWLWNADMPKIDYPLATFAHEALAAGRLPLWNDNLGLGYPLYAEGQVGAFYPPNWLIFQLPPLVALDVTRFLHLVLAGTGAGLLGLRYARSRSAALIAVVVAVLGGAIVTKLEWTNVVAAYGWMPWVWLPFTGSGLPTRRAAVAGGALWGVQALCGHPNTWLLTGIGAVLLQLAAAPRRVVLGRIVPFGVTGGLVGAVQLLPTALLTTLSVRSASMTTNDLFASAATPFDPLGAAFSSAFATATPGGWWNVGATWYPDSLFALLEAGAYVGIPVLILAAVAFTVRRSRPMAVLVIAALVFPVVAAFQPWWWKSIPLLNVLRSPVRAYMVASLAVGVLAAIGAARLGLGALFIEASPEGADGPPKSPRWLRDPSQLALLVFGTAMVAWAAVTWVASNAPDLFDAVYRFSASFLDTNNLPGLRASAVKTLEQAWPTLGEGLIGAVMVFAVGLVLKSGALRRTKRLALVALAALPLFAFGSAPNGTADLAAFDSAATRFVQALRDARPHRLLQLHDPGWYEGMPDLLAAAGVPDIRMFSSLDLAATETLVDDLRDGNVGDDIRRALGIDTIVTFRGGPCPGATLATVEATSGAVICRDDKALHPPYWIPRALASREGGDPTLPIAPSDWIVQTADLGSAAVASTAVSTTPGSLDATVVAPGDGFVWIDRAWWPGWQVSVDGAAVPAGRALGGLLVPVGAGAHVIAARMVPLDALAGLALGLVGVLLAVLWARGEPRPRRLAWIGTRRPDLAPAAGAVSIAALAGPLPGEEWTMPTAAAPPEGTERAEATAERAEGTVEGTEGAEEVEGTERAEGTEGAEPADDEGAAWLTGSGRWAGAAIGGAALVALAAFLWRLLPGVGYWDTAVYQAAAPTGGLVHPTGYPTYLMLGFLWVHLLPFLPPATALNAMTAVAGALAVGAIGLVAVGAGARPWAAAAGALAVGLGTQFWATSARADPHPLHVLLALTVMLLLLRWDRLAAGAAPRADRWLVLAALAFGISMGNHSLTALLAPGIAVFVLTARPAILRRLRSMVQASLALAAGLLVYVYVPLRAGADPAVHHDYAPTTPALLWRYITGADFNASMQFLTASGPGAAMKELPSFLGHVGEWLTPPGAVVFGVLAAIGIAVLLRARRYRLAWLLLATGGLTLYARLTYANGDIERYALYPMAVGGVLAGIGLTGILERLAERIGDSVGSVRMATTGALPLVLAVAIGGVLLPTNGPKVEPMDATCYVDAVTEQAPSRAWFISWWSFMTPLWYAQAVEGQRPDIGLVLAGGRAAAEASARWGDGRPMWLMESGGDLQAVLDAGFTLEPVEACGWELWAVTGRHTP